MKIEAIEQDCVADQDNSGFGGETIVVTRVIVGEVSSPCILSRLMIAALGRPGTDNDMELFHSGDRCIVIWTRPQLSLETTQALINQAIAIPAGL